MSTSKLQRIQQGQNCLTVGTSDALSWTACSTATNQQFSITTPNATTGEVTIKYGDKYLRAVAENQVNLSKIVPGAPWRYKSNADYPCLDDNNNVAGKELKVGQLCLTVSGTTPATANCNCAQGTQNIMLTDVSTGSTAPAGSPSCDCADAIDEAREEGKKEVEDNFPFIAKKGGPLEWGWWIIIGLGVLCLIAIIATYFLASPPGK